MVVKRLHPRGCWGGYALIFLDVKYNTDIVFWENICSKCNSLCCRMRVLVPLTKDEYLLVNRLARELERNILLILRDGQWMIRQNPCGFLDLEKNRCLIYSRRPKFCNDFHCEKGYQYVVPQKAREMGLK